MPSTTSRTPKRLFLALATLLSLPGCVSMGPTAAILAAWDCDKLIPPEVKAHCPAAAVPTTTTTDPVTGQPTITQGQLDGFVNAQTAAFSRCDANRQLAVDVSAECRAQQLEAKAALEKRRKGLNLF